MYRLFTYTFLIVLFSTSFSVAQYQFPKFEKIEPVDLRVKWERDYPDADAIILKDYGEVAFDFNTRTKVRYTYHRRIKILTEKGLSYTQVRIPLKHANGKRTRIQKIQAATYRLNSAGKVMKADVSRRSIQESEINTSHTEISFKFPLVEVGAIIEYTYTYLTEEVRNIRRWTFQKDIPVVLSEYHTYFPGDFHYLQLSNGDLSTIKVEREPYRQRVGGNVPTSRFSSLPNDPGGYDLSGRTVSVRGIHSAYLAKDMPPITREPHVQSVQDYIPGVKFHLTGNLDRVSTSQLSNLFFNRRPDSQPRKKREEQTRITRKSELLGLSRLPHQLPGFKWLDIPSTSHKQQARNWDELNKELLRNGDFGRQIDKYESLVQRGNRIGRRHEEPERKARAIYEHVRKRMTWNGIYSLYATDLEDAYNSKKASGIDINFILLNMLKGSGLNAYPVIIRTRDQGSIIHMLPNLETFNHVIVAVQLPNQIALLDGLSDVVSFGMLPRNDLNLLGFVVDKEEWGWIQINPDDIFSRTCGSFHLDESGTLNGRLEVTHTEYSAAIERGKWISDSMETKEYLQEYVLSGLENKELFKYQVKHLEDTEQPFIINCELATPEFVEVVDDYMFINPMMTRIVSENPFPIATRRYPISFAAPTRDYYLFGMKIPPGYEVAQMPAPIFVRLGQTGGQFVYNVFLDGEHLFITSAIHLAQTYFSSRAYGELTNFFDYVVNKHAEDIVLRRVQGEGM